MNKFKLYPINFFAFYVLYALLIDKLYDFFCKHVLLENLVNTCIVSPLWEEAVYRYAPIEITKRINKELLAPVIIGVSFLFGFGHEGTIYNIYYQGVFGLTLSWIYLISKRPYLSVVFYHGLWNFLAEFIFNK